MDLNLQPEIFLEKLNEINLKNENILNRAYHSIQLCTELLNRFKREILTSGFDSLEEEVNFFKRVKQVPLVKLIYFSEVHSFEIQFPKVDKKVQLKFLENKIGKLNRFFLYNVDFGQYVNSGSAHFDHQYYTREYFDSYYISTSKFYFQDPDFCTPRDMLLGKFKAYTLLMEYMAKRLYEVENSQSASFFSSSIKKIPWPFTNTDWVELVYALKAAGIAKKNNLSIIQLSNLLQQIFDFEPKEIYKTYQELKNRKTSRTLFLDLLIAFLIAEMDKSEE
jgi:hypothetical protein